MTVYLVGAGPGDPGLITVRGSEILERADVVVFDRLVDPSLIDLAPPGAKLIDVGKVPGASRDQNEISELLVDLGRTNESVVRLKGGDPFLFGRGGEEVEALLAAGIRVEVVPGVTSAFAVPAYAGIPVTHRGLSTAVTVVTGHVGDPTAPGGVNWDALAKAGGTLVILMGMATRGEIAQRLIEGGLDAATPVVVVEWGTTAMQRIARTTLTGLNAVDLGSPATIVVGPVAGLDLAWLGSEPLAGWTVVVTRPRKKAQGLVAGLRLAGASVVTLPSIAISGPADGGRALAKAVATVRDYEWIAFTSSNAVERFVAAMRDARDLAGVKLAAVGNSTAAALRSCHLIADLVAREPSAAGLVASIGEPHPQPDGPDRAGPARGGRVLFCRAADALPTLAEGLRLKGWTVDEVEAYSTVKAGPNEGVTHHSVTRARGADAVVFASPTAVRSFVSLLERSGIPKIAVCIGATTAAEARSSGFEEVVTAKSPDNDGLIAAVIGSRTKPVQSIEGESGGGIGSKQ
ncbi:MAG: uroporphyrinogen-III C-methyltransferase [Acidimicrobiales bacterium]